MKYISVITFALILVSCNQRDVKPADTGVADTLKPVPAEKIPDSAGKVDETDAVHLTAKDSLLVKVAERVLDAIKARDFSRLSSFVHPGDGVRFSAYGYIDTNHSQVLSAKQVNLMGQQQRVVNWGRYDAGDRSIKMNINGYFSRFVYDADFLHAEKKNVNEFIGFGNSLNNLKEIYPDCDFTEFYFSGFDPKYEGMDWRTLRLVFRTEKGYPYLVAIIHDEWTI
jgi:hypothetical protein